MDLGERCGGGYMQFQVLRQEDVGFSVNLKYKVKRLKRNSERDTEGYQGLQLKTINAKPGDLRPIQYIHGRRREWISITCFLSSECELWHIYASPTHTK